MAKNEVDGVIPELRFKEVPQNVKDQLLKFKRLRSVALNKKYSMTQALTDLVELGYKTFMNKPIIDEFDEGTD